MKRFLIFILCCTMLFLIGCTQNEPNEIPNGQQYCNATILEIKDGVVLAECVENFSGPLETGDKVSFSLSDIHSDNQPEITESDSIRIVYNEKNVESGESLLLKTVFSIFLLDDDGEIIAN